MKVASSSPRLGNSFSVWSTPKVRGRLSPHPWPPWRVPPCSSSSREIQSWKNTRETSPHPQGYHTSFIWAKNSCCIYIKNALQEPIRSSDHFDMVLTPLPRLWETMLWSTKFPHSFVCTKYSMCTALDHASHHYWTHPILQNISLGTKFSRWENSTQWGTLLLKGGGMI